MCVLNSENFGFLSSKWDLLAQLGKMAEKNVYDDPNTTLLKLRVFAETATKYILAFEEIQEEDGTTQVQRIQLLKKEDLIHPELQEILHTIRKKGNKAAHEPGYGSTQEALLVLQMSHRFAVWMMEVYGEWDFEAFEFVTPEQDSALKENLRQLSDEYEEKVKGLESELEELRQDQTHVNIEKKEQRHRRARKASMNLELTEEETRVMIDEQLRDADWLVDTEAVRYSKGSRPEKNKNKAIAEWPMGKGYADYALFCGLELIGVIEAKRHNKSIISDIEQAKEYSKNVSQRGEEIINSPNEQYRVPFLFATNGRPYFKQVEEKSGIWFLDARKSTNHPRPLKGWYTPNGLKELLKKDVELATKNLRQEKLDYLNLRPYQEDAITAVETALENGKQEALLALATGTGKTRLAIGLIYRLIKHNRFNRILFLVDRSALGEQAEAAFKDSKLESYMSFTEIFNLQTLKDIQPEEETKVKIATVQGMVRRLFYNEDDSQKPTIDQYDCIIIDEAHRGYTLDKEMSDVEMTFRDHQEYVSKYRQVLEYFDAVRVGLTATPALHTRDIFGSPVYTYSYRDAVIDGYLIDHGPPFQFETVLKNEGIHWKVGDEVEVYNTLEGQIEKEVLEDEIDLDVAHFNKKVITESFNRVILKELTNYVDPEGLGKTLIFAATDDHADMIVRILKEELENLHGPIEDNAVMKITGSIKDPSSAIRHFKNERLPNIVVTVDLLTTGIDVPEISNLVFLRTVRSRILYEQMLGRATRRADEIGKDHFSIFDAVGLYEALEPYTDMKPVVANPTVSVDQLLEELEQIEGTENRKKHQEELIAKIQRKKQRWTEEEIEDFQSLNGGESIHEFVDWIKSSPVDEVIQKLQSNKQVVNYLDENRKRPSKQYISTHEDEITAVKRGYGKAEKPEDYLQEFNQFIQENMNEIPALQLVCTRPSDLTREQLRELRLTLDQHGYNETSLQTAWRDARNEEIAADIISFIRQQALGDPLVSHEERIKAAMKRVYQMQNWPPVQRKWLERIEQQLLKESVLDPDPERAFESEPFKSKGGYKQLDKIFNRQLDEIVYTINDALYNEEKREQA